MRRSESPGSRWRDLRPRGGLAALAATALLLGASSAQAEAPERKGFTLETTLGGGFQQRSVDDSLRGGLFGLTFGIGWFVTEDLAVLGRVMNSIIWEQDDFRTVTGVAGAVAQYWLLDRIRLEAGPGVGWGRRVGVDDFREEVGFGLLTGIGVAVWQNKNHALTVGLEYAPVFLDGITIHAAGGVIGWQLL